MSLSSVFLFPRCCPLPVRVLAANVVVHDHVVRGPLVADAQDRLPLDGEAVLVDQGLAPVETAGLREQQ